MRQISVIFIIACIMALTKNTPEERKQALVLLQDFRDLQEERIRQYNKLNQSHKVYLETGKGTGGQDYDFNTYKASVKESTDKFQSISLKIIDIAKKLETITHIEDAETQPPISYIKKIQVIQRQ